MEVYSIHNDTKTTTPNEIKYLKEYTDYTAKLYSGNTIAVWHITLKTKNHESLHHLRSPYQAYNDPIRPIYSN